VKLLIAQNEAASGQLRDDREAMARSRQADARGGNGKLRHRQAAPRGAR
jgi:hypothetical protein